MPHRELRQFLRRTYQPGGADAVVRNKAASREALRALIFERAPTHLMALRFVTMPSAWWHFERLVRKRALHDDMPWTPTFYAVESDSAIFRLAAHRIPAFNPDHVALTQFTLYNRAAVANNFDVLLVHDMVERFLHYLDHRVHVIWLDYCSQFLPRMAVGLAEIARVLDPHWGLFALTLCGAREYGEINEEMAHYPSREVYLTSKVEALLGRGFDLLTIDPYLDTSPMLQFVWERRGTRTFTRHYPFLKGAPRVNDIAHEHHGNDAPSDVNSILEESERLRQRAGEALQALYTERKRIDADITALEELLGTAKTEKKEPVKKEQTPVKEPPAAKAAAKSDEMSSEEKDALDEVRTLLEAHGPMALSELSVRLYRAGVRIDTAKLKNLMAKSKDFKQTGVGRGTKWATA